jgi:surfactin synthase thioesterase subunit
MSWSSSWLKGKRNHQSKVNVVCFPYAGGSSPIFKNWQRALGDEVQVIPVELPGHGGRIREQLRDSAVDLANELYTELIPLFSKPVVFLGHSMGAILAFETSRLLIERGFSPAHFFAVAAWPPHKKREHITYELTDDQFLNRVKELGGIPREVLEHAELLSFILPILRADFKVAEGYVYDGDQPVMSCPITVLAGSEDSFSIELLNKWRELTAGSFSLQMFQGGHFFLQQAEESVLPVIKQKLDFLCEI